jgi:hypothetical protein
MDYLFGMLSAHTFYIGTNFEFTAAQLLLGDLIIAANPRLHSIIAAGQTPF